jgi:hypothetical protein
VLVADQDKQLFGFCIDVTPTRVAVFPEPGEHKEPLGEIHLTFHNGKAERIEIPKK